jgi:hypothetical protein
MQGPRLLLVELLNDDPLHQHRAKIFPFIQGWVSGHGGSCRWVTVSAGRDARPNHPFLVEPPGETLQLVAEAVAGFAPTHLLSNERLGDAFVEAIAASAPDAVLVQPPHALLTRTKTADLGAFLGLPDAPESNSRDDRLILAVGLPDYTHERLDPATPAADHFLPVVVEPRCLYRRSLRRNPFFDDVPLEGVEFARGCAFCTFEVGVEPILSPDEAVERVLLQFRRYVETVPEAERRSRFMMHVSPAFSRMKKLFQGLLALDLPPSSFYFTCRADELLSMGGALRESLPALAERCHALHFWQVGLENFSAEENERFNKGITPEQVEEAVALVGDLERTWPAAFVFREHGAFGMIVFTPWTRLEDLRTNVREVKRHRLFEQYAMLTTSLQLRAGTPLEALAEKDGLVLRADDLDLDPFNTTCITHWGEDEIAWRFKHPEVASVFGAMRRIFPQVGAEPMDLTKDEKENPPEGPPPSAYDPATVLGALIDLAEADPGAGSEALLDRLSGKLAELGRPKGLPYGTEPEWVHRLAALISEDEGRPWCSRAGAKLLETWPRRISGDDHCLAALFEVKGAQVELRLSLAEPGVRAFRVAGPIAISHANATPLDSREKMRVVDALAALLVRWAARALDSAPVAQG